MSDVCLECSCIWIKSMAVLSCPRCALERRVKELEEKIGVRSGLFWEVRETLNDLIDGVLASETGDIPKYIYDLVLTLKRLMGIDGSPEVFAQIIPKPESRECKNCAVGVCSEHQPESQPEYSERHRLEVVAAKRAGEKWAKIDRDGHPTAESQPEHVDWPEDEVPAVGFQFSVTFEYSRTEKESCKPPGFVSLVECPVSDALRPLGYQSTAGGFRDVGTDRQQRFLTFTKTKPADCQPEPEEVRSFPIRPEMCPSCNVVIANDGGCIRCGLVPRSRRKRQSALDKLKRAIDEMDADLMKATVAGDLHIGFMQGVIAAKKKLDELE